MEYFVEFLDRVGMSQLADHSLTLHVMLNAVVETQAKLM